MILVEAEEALAEAKIADAEIRSGRRRGPLHGIPIAVKDVIDVRGWPTTAGSKLFEGHVAEKDADCVARLREAGAIIIGKTNLHELTVGGHGNPWFGKVVNPLNPERGTGGTSSGSAAAVAAGYCVAAIATDTGGSNRSPAAATGLVGYKPARGAVSNAGALPTAPTFDAIGPIAVTVRDAWFVYSAMRGNPDSKLREVELSGLKIGVCPDLNNADVDPAVGSAQRTWLEAAASAGATIKVLHFAQSDEVKEAGKAILMYEFALKYAPLINAHPEKVGEAVRNFVSEGLSIGEDGYRSALAYRADVMSHFQQMIGSVDVLASPVAPGLAPRLSDEMTRVGADWVPYGTAGGSFRRWANFFDVASIAIPLPIAGDLPASIQIAALSSNEEALFSAAQALSHLS
ncbi:aspartyl-tRNA(Asn)/glutamyl-tRNA(Gln) amidotransferase subunit A [Neorhizobium sp. 2083]|nr:aspartyl-tRNA(Asn)/glutamyl-tRNA(Gln) amidotransferase subunit A [Neorhizobium sp. 2083]